MKIIREKVLNILAGGDLHTSAICRKFNNLSENNSDIAWCGLCKDYANIRKRIRSNRLPPELPWIESGSFKVHRPCAYTFTALMKLVKRMVKDKLIISYRGKVPDYRQPRLWDYATIYKKL